VVEHVFTGSRFKVRIPQQNCAVMLSLLGLKCLAPDTNQPEQDKVAKEAIDLARNTVFQRDVEVEINACDQRGTFFGTVFVKGRNFAVPLLEAGLAVARDSNTLSPYRLEYNRAQEASQKALIGVFNPRLNSLSANVDPALAARGCIRCALTEIVDCSTFFVQLLDNDNLSKVARLSHDFDPSSAAALQEPIKYGVKCWGKFREDNQWYRGTVLRKVARNYIISFFDYGNEDEVELSQLRQLSGKALEIPPLALQCKFSFLRPQKNGDPLGNEAGQNLRELAWGQDMYVKILSTDRAGASYVVLSHDPNEELNTVNCELVGRGLARMDRNARALANNRYIPYLLEREDYARKRRLGVWAISEYSDDEDEDYD
jgi:staphylococcal nuclease domain-containing protein 1